MVVSEMSAPFFLSLGLELGGTMSRPEWQLKECFTPTTDLGSHDFG